MNIKIPDVIKIIIKTVVLKFLKIKTKSENQKVEGLLIFKLSDENFRLSDENFRLSTEKKISEGIGIVIIIVGS